MNQLARLLCAAAAAIVVAVTLSACSQVVGPTLTVSIENRQLAPSSNVPNAAAICCCRVRGVIRNTSSIPVHVDVRFYARDGNGNSLGTALDWVRDIPAGGTKTFDAAGIIARCQDVVTIVNDPLAYGVYSLPN